MTESGKAWLPLIVVACIMAALPLLFSAPDDQKTLVVYCAHDAIYAQDVLDRFSTETGIPVSVRFDTEATKSLGLINLIIAERDQPRCDVFWNNQVSGTVQLQGEGLLEPYRGSGWRRIPNRYKDPEGHWVGFGGRLRVYIVNTSAMSATEANLNERLTGDLSHAAIAKPLFGTTLSHYSLLWEELGEAGAKQWHHDLRRRGIREASGNSMVKNLVAEGVCDFGWTDTDDVFVAKDAGQPVEMLPIRLDDGRTICLPNSAAIIRGTQRPEAAQQLVDYLASESNEVALAKSRSRQVPLGPVDADKLPEDVRTLVAWAADGVDIRRLAAGREACLEWLKHEYLD